MASVVPLDMSILRTHVARMRQIHSIDQCNIIVCSYSIYNTVPTRKLVQDHHYSSFIQLQVVVSMSRCMGKYECQSTIVVTNVFPVWLSHVVTHFWKLILRTEDWEYMMDNRDGIAPQNLFQIFSGVGGHQQAQHETKAYRGNLGNVRFIQDETSKCTSYFRA